MDVIPNMTCPSGGQFYACGDGSRFVGCCASNPCTVGCPAGNLQTTSFDRAQYGQIPDQQCSTGLFYTCNFTNPSFWGCCTSPACAGTSGCASTALAGAFLTTNEALAQPFLSLNETWQSSTTDAGNAASSDDNASTSKSGGGTNTGAIAGGVVGGIAAIALIIFGFIWLHRRRKRRTAAAAPAPLPDRSNAPEEGDKAQIIQELSHDASTAVGFGELPPNWPSSPSMPSYHSSPEFPHGEWSPRPPSYLTDDPRAKPQHMSYELPGTQAGVEMDTPRGGEQDPKSLPSFTSSGR